MEGRAVGYNPEKGRLMDNPSLAVPEEKMHKANNDKYHMIRKGVMVLIV